ncbi:MAG: DUF2357 domain-containing protein [Roseiflexaceae bacterium]|nr:DUF2357 domain-containing protein [Roseiflexaceae bacterium]
MIEIHLEPHASALPPIQEHQAVEFVCASGANPRRLLVDGMPLEPFLRPGEAAWRWRYNPGAAVGLHTALLERDDGPQRWQLRCEPRKLDIERYHALLADLQRTAQALAYELGGSAAEAAHMRRAGDEPPGRLESYYAIFEGQFPAFERAVRRIAQRPREQLTHSEGRTPFSQASSVGAAALVRLAQGDFDEAPPGIADDIQAALRPGGGLLPRAIAEQRALPSYDTYEHRLLQHVLGLLLRHARITADLAAREAARASFGARARAVRIGQIGQGCVSAQRTLAELRALPFLAEVAALPAFRGATPLLQRDAGYREVYRMWQALRQQPTLELDSTLFSIPIAELPYLYESWCALQVASAIVLLGGDVLSQNLITVARPGEEGQVLRTVAVPSDTPLLIARRGDLELRLRYQPRYRPAQRGPAQELHSLDRHTRVPDLALELRRDGQTPQVLIFDAKYRLDEDGRGVPQDALSDAYAYLGAIGVAGQRATVGALLLYPGTHDERYPSGVGALALLPDRTDTLGDVLRSYLE